MKIKISKSQWEGIGKKAGWIKEAGNKIDYLKYLRHRKFPG